MRKLDILVPIYNEGQEMIKALLDSIAIQQNVDLRNDVGVIICCDGGTTRLTQEFVDSYPFYIEFYICEHNGVSATRNECLAHSTAEYVMFCDADDMFYNACGMYILFREMMIGQFDALMSVFIEETRHPVTREPLYINHEIDSTFVHGKVYRRQYLIANDIKFNPALTIHEDSYFNCLAQKCAAEVKYCPTPFYLWRWQDNSVCRHDPKYILKTYNNMLESNTALVNELIRRDKKNDAMFFATSMMYDAYFTMNKDEWVNQENKEYRDKTEQRFKKYYLDFKNLIDTIDDQIKAQIIMGMKNRFYQEGLLMEKITFDDWIDEVMKW